MQAGADRLILGSWSRMAWDTYGANDVVWSSAALSLYGLWEKRSILKRMIVFKLSLCLEFVPGFMYVHFVSKACLYSLQLSVN